MILNETYQFQSAVQFGRMEGLSIMEVCVGLHLTAVRLSDGSYGFASTLDENCLPCMKSKRDFGDFTPTHIRGQKVTDLFTTNKSTAVVDTLKIAVLNALSSQHLPESDYNIIENTDPIDLIDLSGNKTITVVGGFHSYIDKISRTDNRLIVLELNENALLDEHRTYYMPARDFPTIIPQSDVVIITGLTLVNHTIDGLLSCIVPGTQVVVTGPSSSIVPDILFANNVNIIGATRLTRPELLFGIAAEGGAAYHLFKYCAQKICILNGQ